MFFASKGDFYIIDYQRLEEKELFLLKIFGISGKHFGRYCVILMKVNDKLLIHLG